MTIRNSGKLNLLYDLLPEGLLVNAAWLERHGYSRALRKQYVSNGWLTQPMRGVFYRSRGKLSWEQVIISIQAILEIPVSIGGRTALEIQGYGHYVYQKQRSVQLYTDTKLPSWLFKLPNMPEFQVHNRSRFLPETNASDTTISLNIEYMKRKNRSLPGALLIEPWGQWHWPMIVSSPERAILEVMDDIPNEVSFDMADKLMSGLHNLRPRTMQSLLETTTSIKVKRLFFYLAERHHFQWLREIDQSKIDFGKGKRVIEKDGKLDTKYLITVPRVMDDL